MSASYEMLQRSFYCAFIIQRQMAKIRSLRRILLIQQQNTSRPCHVLRVYPVFKFNGLVNQDTAEPVLFHKAEQLLFRQGPFHRNGNPIIPSGHPDIGSAAARRQQLSVNKKAHAPTLGKRCGISCLIPSVLWLVTQSFHCLHHPLCNLGAYIPGMI